MCRVGAHSKMNEGRQHTSKAKAAAGPLKIPKVYIRSYKQEHKYTQYDIQPVDGICIYMQSHDITLHYIALVIHYTLMCYTGVTHELHIHYTHYLHTSIHTYIHVCITRTLHSHSSIHPFIQSFMSFRLISFHFIHSFIHLFVRSFIQCH